MNDIIDPPAGPALSLEEIPVPARQPHEHADITIYGTPEQRSALWLAVGKARVGFEKVTKSIVGQTGQQKFKYASFAQLSAAMVEPLAENGVTIMQMITTPTEGIGCVTTLLAGHGAELWVVTRFPTVENEHGFQATIKDFGAQTTYYKRYQLQALGLIEGDRDADQEPNDMPGPARSTKAPPPREVKVSVSDEQYAEMGRLVKAHGWKRNEALAFTADVFGKAKDPNDMTREEGDKLILALKDNGLVASFNERRTR